MDSNVGGKVSSVVIVSIGVDSGMAKVVVSTGEIVDTRVVGVLPSSGVVRVAEVGTGVVLGSRVVKVEVVSIGVVLGSGVVRVEMVSIGWMLGSGVDWLEVGSRVVGLLVGTVLSFRL